MEIIIVTLEIAVNEFLCWYFLIGLCLCLLGLKNRKKAFGVDNDLRCELTYLLMSTLWPISLDLILEHEQIKPTN